MKVLIIGVIVVVVLLIVVIVAVAAVHNMRNAGVRQAYVRRTEKIVTAQQDVLDRIEMEALKYREFESILSSNIIEEIRDLKKSYKEIK